MSDAHFPSQLQLVLKILVISRTGLAAALDVDKSLVGRWASGAVKPSNNNLAKLTRFVAERVPGFTALDWEKDMPAFAARLGVDAEKEDAGENWFPPEFVAESKRRLGQRGALYRGLWRSTRPSHDLPGRFIHDITMIWSDDEGRFHFSIGTEGVRYHGWSIMLGNQVFGMAFDVEGLTAMFSLFQGVAHQKPYILDGINLATLRDAGGSPTASRCILERVADLTGDRAEDEAHFERLIAELNPLAEEGSIDPQVADALTRDVTGEAEGILRVLYSQTLSRGATLSEVSAAAAK